MTFHVIIPARYGSERFPGKPLIDLAGKPMIQRVYERARLSRAASVQVATDDQRIADAVHAFGGEVVMTSACHASGTDRVQEAATKAGLGAREVIVNVQGDEPAIPPAAINLVAEILGDSGAPMATLCEPITSAEDVFNPNQVKVVRDSHGRALYFSRAPLPYARDAFADSAAACQDTGWLSAADAGWLRHLGIYAYTKALLDEFVTWPASPLEKVERLEQLRALEKGVHIQLALADVEMPPGIDTPQDVARALRYIEE